MSRLPGLAIFTFGLAALAAARVTAGPWWAGGFTPATWPALAALTLAVLGLIVLTEGATPGPGATAPEGRAAGAALAAIVAGAALIPWLGFPLAAALVLAALSWLFGGRSVSRVSAFSGLGAVAVWLFFESVMRFPLPDGRVWDGAWNW